METTVQFNIEKLEYLQRELARTASAYVKVGVASGKDTRNRVYPPDCETILKTNTKIARDHEFGNPAAIGPCGESIPIPERSILRMPMKLAMGDELSKVNKYTYEKIIRNDGVDGILDKVGSVAVNLVDKNFEKQGYPEGWRPISYKTLLHRRKHDRDSKKLLDDSGQLRSSFDYEVVA